MGYLALWCSVFMKRPHDGVRPIQWVVFSCMARGVVWGSGVSYDITFMCCRRKECFMCRAQTLSHPPPTTTSSQPPPSSHPPKATIQAADNPHPSSHRPPSSQPTRLHHLSRHKSSQSIRMPNLLEDIQCAGSDTRPPMFDRTDFASWKQRIRLYYHGKENGVNFHFFPHFLSSSSTNPITPTSHNHLISAATIIPSADDHHPSRRQPSSSS
nr:hypothetical protein [Tanacetum cinerariifolium]